MRMLRSANRRSSHLTHRAAGILLIVAFTVAGALVAAPRPSALAAQDASAAPPPADDDLSALIIELGHEEYARREAATSRLLTRGSNIAPALLQRLAAESDPEIRHRLRFVLECIVPPENAVLVLNAEPQSGVSPGDLITHVGAWRVRHASELRNLLSESTHTPMSVRVATATGPRDVPRLDRDSLLTFCDYVAPRGEAIASAMRLLRSGLAEQADAKIVALGPELNEAELPTLARARLAAVAGRTSDALKLLAATPEVVKPGENENRWLAASPLDRVLPGKAPFYLEWTLWNLVREGVEVDGDPDLRTQRILVPAGRYVDALHAAVGYWTSRFRSVIGTGEPQTRNAGNMLAVSSWMLYELSLLSECERLIEPRSLILRASPNSPRKWMRVQTDAWLPFYAGDPAAATATLYSDALDVLQNPVGMGPQQVLIRNPVIAAQIAFFLFQSPADPGIAEILNAVNRREHAGLPSFIDWMLFALREDNADRIRTHFDELLPNVSGPDAARLLLARGMLEYAAARDPAVFASMRERLAATSEAERASLPGALPTLDVLTALAAGLPADAERTLPALQHEPGYTALRHTLAFRAQPPPGAAAHIALKNPLLAVPLGLTGEQWVVLAADRSLQVFNARSGELAPLDPPTPNWYPSPRNWPWLGRDDRSGRVFAYGLRRVTELGSDATPGGIAFRISLRTDQIGAFDRLVAPVFGEVAAAVLAEPILAGETGEYLRADLRANTEYAADPDLPELGTVRVSATDDRLVHVAFRGGPHLLLDRRDPRIFSARIIGDALGLPHPPNFFVEAAAREGDTPPAALLLSDQGLIRYSGATGFFTRVALPGDEPFPTLLPESAPYARRDPRWVYFARTPDDGGQVYRLALATGEIEAVDLINIAVPPDYYAVRSRADLRRQIDDLFLSTEMQTLEAFVTDAAEAVAKLQEPPQ